ncbi:MAG: helix-turn-helix domain-containing protein [Blastocatellia bacterium]
MIANRKKLNAQIYGRLLADALPRPIETEEENERALAIVNKLISQGERKLTPEEQTLLRLLVRLIEDFEEKAYPIPEAPAWRVLQTLMENRGVRQADLLHIFGSRGIASEVVNGKRAISKAQAKALGEFFKVSPELFI